MYRLISLLRFSVLVAIISASGQELLADCTGCCSGHGGVVCVGGVTKCADGTALSSTCVNKGCNVCGSTVTMPTVSTGSASSVMSSSAVLNGNVNPNGSSTSCYFQYGNTTGYGSTTASASVGSGNTSVSATATLTGLSSGTTYHYRLVATNSAGTGYGNDATLTTTSSQPATTNPTATGSANPATASAGGNVLLAVNVIPGTNPTSTGITVSGDLTPFGGPASQPFYDNGSNGDSSPGDNKFSYLASIAGTTSPGSKQIAVTVRDGQSRSATTSISISVTGATTTDSNQLIFPHIADGGGYKTVLLLTNRTSTNTTATVSFCSSSGTPLTVTIGPKTATSFTVPIQARGAAKITTSGVSSSTSQGWVQVTSSPSVTLGGNAIFQYFSGPNLTCEASVPAAPLANQMDFYDDEEGGFITGFAVANPGNVTASGTLTAYDTAGSLVGTYPLSIQPGQHTAVFLYQIIRGATSGRAEINLLAGTLSAAALRYHTSGVFSTVSITPADGVCQPISALFSPRGGVRSRLISEIEQAVSTIDIAIYSFTADEIRNALVAAKARGVSIRIVADASQANGSGTEIGTLESLGFDLKRVSGSSGGIMHNKYMITDGKALVTGSYNWSANAEDNNFENAIFVETPTVVQSYVTDFERLWQR